MIIVLLELSPISTQDRWSLANYLVLGHLSHQGPVALFGQIASSRKSPGHPKLLSFKNYRGHCTLVNIKCSRNVLWVVPRHNAVSELRVISLTSWLDFCSDMHCDL